MQVVWFKRDLRLRDHRPLVEAAARGLVLPLYIYEPSLWSAPDASPRHWAFVAGSLAELRDSLARLGAPLVVRVGEAVEVLQSLPVTALWAHQETGNSLSYARDRAVRRWARERQIPFTEFPMGGVVRGLRSRDGWSKIWESRMAEAILPPPGALLPHNIDPGPIPPASPAISIQRPGETAAHEVLDSFLARRGVHYHAELSSPLSAAEACSRLSVHLAWGTISSRQVTQALRARQQTAEGSWKRALRAFDARLHWRDHFIQKLEDEPRIEYENFVRAYDGMRERSFNAEWYDAWREGRTGFPFIDACMRYLAATGWINFRMRAMLVSFAAYHLWLDWRPVARHLAQLFTDYEPGIHYSQCQMQSGTTGINTLRIYNPDKQWKDQDPDSVFVRQWVPEFDAPGYPRPLVDHASAVKLARERISAVRRRADTRAEAAAVQQKHGSRKRPPARRPRAEATIQQKLLF